MCEEGLAGVRCNGLQREAFGSALHSMREAVLSTLCNLHTEADEECDELRLHLIANLCSLIERERVFPFSSIPWDFRALLAVFILSIRVAVNRLVLQIPVPKMITTTIGPRPRRCALRIIHSLTIDGIFGWADCFGMMFVT